MVSASQAANGSDVSHEKGFRLKAIREIKNCVIGNRFKKLQYLHVLPELQSLVRSNADAELQVQAIAAIGSLAYGVEDGVKAIVDCNGVDSLVHALLQDDQRVVVAAARSLKLVYQADQVVAAGAVPALVQLLVSSQGATQEAAVEALVALTRYSNQACQQLLCNAISNNSSSGSSSSPNAQLKQQHQDHAGNSTDTDASAVPQQQQQYSPALQQLLHLMKQHNSRMRFLCGSCVSNISSKLGSTIDPLQQQLPNACRCALPYVVRLLAATETAANSSSETHAPGRPAHVAYNSESRYLFQVPLVLSTLIHDRPELLKLAVELDTIQILIKLLHSKAATAPVINSETPAPPAAVAVAPANIQSPAAAAKAARLAAAAAAAAAAAEDALTLRRGCLTALAALAMLGDEARQKMVDGGRLVSAAVAGLSDSNADIRVAAAGVLRGLSRSVKVLRGSAIPSSVAGPLVALLQDERSSEVQVAAAAAVCNLVLGFSHVRPALIKAGVFQALTPLLTSMVPELRLHAIWAFKNLAHECDIEVQGLLLSEMTWQGFRELLVADDDVRVRGQAVGLLQNFLCRGPESIDKLMAWSEGGLLPLLADRLDPAIYSSLWAPAAAAAAGADSNTQHLKAQLVGLLFSVSNICSGSESHKAAVMASRLPTLLLRYLHMSISSTAAAAAAGPSSSTIGASSICEVHTAAVWCVINLLWCEEVNGASNAADAAQGSAQGSDAAAAAASAAARAAVLKELGFEDALKSILACCAPGSSSSSAAVGGAVGQLLGDSGRQDLVERAQTALQLLHKLSAK